MSSCYRYPYYLSVLRETSWMSPFYMKKALSVILFLQTYLHFGEGHYFDTA